MNKWTKKAIAVCLCVVLCLSGTVLAFAKTEKEETKTETKEKKQETTSQEELSKDETVYVLAGADGSVQKVIVSDWIKNAVGSESVTDQSDLSEIENVKGDESYTMNGDNMKVWDAQGNDIYYQGNIEKELPVGLRVTYQLDGKNVSAQEMAGKSGKATIRFDYENRQYEMVDIDGQKEKIYVPFAMLTGMMLDSDVFRNVEVSNGKMFHDGDHTIVAGLAFPGLQENLGLSEEKLEIPDYVEITADVENFSFGMTVTLATNEIFSELDAEKMDSLDGMNDSLTELTDAMDQLIDGSSALYDGLCTLLEKSGELVNGVDQLTEGAKELKEGAGSLDEGAARLQAGLSELTEGLSALSSNSGSLNQGAKQVFESLLSTAETQIKAAGISIPSLTIENYGDVLKGVIDSLDEDAVYDKALKQVTKAVEEKRPEITEKVTEAVKSQVEEQVTLAVKEQVEEQVIQSALNMSKEQYDALVEANQIPEETQKQVQAALEEQLQSEKVKGLIQANTETQMQSEKIQTTVKQQTEAQVQKAIADQMESDTVKAQLAAASEGTKTMIQLKTSLDSYNAFYLGLCSYTAGVDSAAAGAGEILDGADDLKDGTAQLKEGAATLYDGVLTLKDGMPALTDGVTKLRDGSMELSDGLKQLNEEGIQKLVELVDGDLSELSARLRATVDVSKEYRNFAGISDEMDGQVKFIYRTDEIKAE